MTSMKKKLQILWKKIRLLPGTGKSLSEALIFASTNPQYDNRLFMKIVSSKYLQNMLFTQIVVFVLFWHSEQFWHTTCSADVASFWKIFTCMSCNKFVYKFWLWSFKNLRIWIFYPWCHMALMLDLHTSEKKREG